MATDNPGTVLASEVDAEIVKFRELQQELQQYRSDMQTLISQQTENEMVAQELDAVEESDNVFKKIGPVLVKQDIDESKDALRRRLEFIKGEQKKLETKIAETEKKGNELAARIQKMQAALQQATAQAVQSISQQHGSKE